LILSITSRLPDYSRGHFNI